MNIPVFSIARFPRIEFGSGKLNDLPAFISQFGKRILIVTGAASFRSTDHWQTLLEKLADSDISYLDAIVSDEPSPQRVDDMVKQFKDESIDVVVGIGGGSVLDAAKAVAGLLHINHSVLDFLEGVGPELPYPGPATPFIAVPTTAGTGSEATKNAVLSLIGENGYKKSFRDEQLVPQYAVVDPQLLASCPPELIAANGMDALTQLMESYVSTRSNPMTDALAKSGLRLVRDSLLSWYEKGNEAPAEALEAMAYAALQSGICLAQTGLGSVHGLASPLGAYWPIPHGVVCGTLVATCTLKNIETMLDREPDNPALKKYATLGTILTNKKHASVEESRMALVTLLQEWTEKMPLPRLSELGIKEQDFDKIIANSRGNSMKTNPIVLTDDDIREILTDRF